MYLILILYILALAASALYLQQKKDKQSLIDISQGEEITSPSNEEESNDMILNDSED